MQWRLLVSEETRGAKDLCYGDVRPLRTLLARVLGVAPGVGYACLKHRRALEKEDERCSFVLSSSHSKNLMSIPRTLYQFHDEWGKTVKSYCPGGKWCNKCWACYYRKIKTNERVSLLACVITRSLHLCCTLESTLSNEELFLEQAFPWKSIVYEDVNVNEHDWAAHWLVDWLLRIRVWKILHTNWLLHISVWQILPKNCFYK